LKGVAVQTSTSSSIKPRIVTIDGLSIRVAESEMREEHAFLLSPWPESLFAFDQIWNRLAEHTHLVAVDLPGFGHSEGRESLFSPRAMGEFLIRIADEYGIEHPHMVGPDVGTGAVLFAAADNPGRIKSIVVGSGGASYPLELGGMLEDWVSAPDVMVFRELDARQIVSGALAGLERYELPDSVRADYLSSYEGDRFVESMAYVRAYPKDLQVLRDLLPQIETPVQIIGALWDWAVPPSNHRYLHRRLPNNKLDLLDAAHFPWEDAADQYADLIASWWAGGFAHASRNPSS
jgi:pimeloyl-ACP methyl ester carboxylesterase